MKNLKVFKVATKYIVRSKKHKLLMIAIGCVTFFIIVGKGYQLGLKKQIDYLQYYGYTGDFIIVNSNVRPKSKPEFLNVEKDEMLCYEHLKFKLLEKFYNQIEYILPRYVTKSMVMGKDEETCEYITLLGVNFADEYKVGIFKLFNFISLSLEHKEDGIYVSNKIAKKLNLELGSNVYCFIITKDEMPKPAKFIVEGIFESKGFPALVDFLCCVEFEKLNKILKNGNKKCSYIQIILKNKSDINSKIVEIEKALTNSYSLYNFKKAAPFFDNIKKAIDITSFGSLLFQYVAVFLFIYSSIYMLIIAKKNEVAIMYTLGLSTKEVILFFLTGVSILILSPALIGMICGLIVNYIFSIIGIPALNEAMKYMFASDRLYFDFNILLSISIVVMITIVGIFASLIPLVSIKKIDVREQLQRQI